MRLMSLQMRSSKWKTALTLVMVFCLGFGILASPQTASALTIDTGKFSIQTVTIPGGGTGDDHVDLSAHVYIPNSDDPEAVFPAIVFIHSWCMNELEYEAKMAQFAADGYITICYTCRGWYGAAGHDQVAGPLEMADLNAVVDWLIDNTPVDENNIGATGISYGGGHSMLALQFEPRFKTVVPMSGWTDLYESLAPNDSLKYGWCGFLAASGMLLANPDDTMTDWISDYLSGYDMQSQEGTKVRSAVTYMDEINDRRVPLFIVQGINDDLFTSDQMIDFYCDYQGPKKLTLGKGVHATSEMPGLLGFDSQIWNDTKDWFDYWLKGIDTGIMNEPPVSVYQEWNKSQATYDSWPVADDELVLYPSKSLPTGKLKEKPGKPNSIELKNKMISVSATSGVFFLSPILQQHLGVYVPGASPLTIALNDGATMFQTDRLSKDVTVCGTPQIRFAVETANKYQLNFFIYDVNRLGIATMVGHIPYTSKGDTVEANEKVVDLDMNVLAHKFKKGHSLRLVVTTSDASFVLPVKGNFKFKLLCGDDSFKLTLPTL